MRDGGGKRAKRYLKGKQNSGESWKKGRGRLGAHHGMMLGIGSPNGRTTTSMPGAQRQRRVGDSDKGVAKRLIGEPDRAITIESSEVKTA